MQSVMLGKIDNILLASVNEEKCTNNVRLQDRCKIQQVSQCSIHIQVLCLKGSWLHQI